MKKDIANRQDIELFIRAFYKKVLQDNLIQHFFNEVVSLDLETHFPKLIDFWEMTLFARANNYSGNPMQIHKHLNSLSPMKKEHFDKWLALFNETIDEHFMGYFTELAKQRALSIATLMQIKINSL